MSDAAIPAVPEVGTPPVAPPATPAVVPESVTLSKEAHDQLAKDAARASGNQRKADLYDKLHGSRGNSPFKPQAPVTPPTQDEQRATMDAEDRKAERGLLALALDPAYREVFDKDQTLREIITKNPLAILPMFAPDALDADDAISLVREALDKRKPASAFPAILPVAPVLTPPVGGVNPQASPVNEAAETARKLPNTERAIAGMVGARLKESAGKR